MYEDIPVSPEVLHTCLCPADADNVSIPSQAKPRAKKPAKAKVEDDPEERLDDDFLAEIFASAEEEVRHAIFYKKNKAAASCMSEPTTAKNQSVMS